MAITGISHIAIGVRDMDSALSFYRDGIGMALTLDREEIFGGMYPRNRRACYLRWELGPGTSFIVLDQHLSQVPDGQAAQMYDLGVHHFAFLTDDIVATAARLKEAGFEVEHEGHVGEAPGYGLAVGQHRIGTLFAHDPDGNIIQFDQWLS